MTQEQMEKAIAEENGHYRPYGPVTPYLPDSLEQRITALEILVGQWNYGN